MHVNTRRKHTVLTNHILSPFSGYLVAVPSELRPGTEEVLSVTILKPSEPILVEAKLFSKSSELLTSTGHEIFGKFLME